MTPEGKVKAQVKKVLSRHGAYYHCPVQNGMGAMTLDFVGCHCGKYFTVETKAPGKHPTPRQLMTMEQVDKAGGKCFVVSNDVQLAVLDNWLDDAAHEGK